MDIVNFVAAAAAGVDCESVVVVAVSTVLASAVALQIAETEVGL